jgi:hypothetical protein
MALSGFGSMLWRRIPVLALFLTAMRRAPGGSENTHSVAFLPASVPKSDSAHAAGCISLSSAMPGFAAVAARQSEHGPRGVTRPLQVIWNVR